MYAPASVLENGRTLLNWDRFIITDRTIVVNKPDIVIVDWSHRRAVLVDITMPHDENLVKAEKDKLSKYFDLAHEVTAMWDVDCYPDSCIGEQSQSDKSGPNMSEGFHWCQWFFFSFMFYTSCARNFVWIQI